MQFRAAHLAASALAALTMLTSVGIAQASTSAAHRTVSRYTAYQACQAATWRWTAENAEIGTSVAPFRHRYRPEDVWREQGGWHVQVSGKRGEAVSMSNDVAYCVVAGTDARPKLVDHSFPR